MTAEIGRVLGGRYRLVAPIGLGASAQVFLADDVRLRRRVAVKMLHDALAGDMEFLRRFRAEARAAAALSHPNVMAVYDWGDEDTAFIVTEYLAGGSLRALLDGGNLLTPSQALNVGLEAARALDYAHRRGFVHRDIKPANLLFGDDQRLRIADFGLARALAEAAWTEPQGAILGTARYASPEQAKGEKLSGRSDVYSLALVLVEAVTGQVPFATDTTLGTLMARVDRDLEVPDELEALRDVLARAGRHDPDERIDARALATGLLRAAKALPKPELLPLAGALLASGEPAADIDPTIHAPTTSIQPEPEADLRSDDLDLDPPDWVNQAEPLMPFAAVAGAAAVVSDGPGGIASMDTGIDPEPAEERIVVDEAVADDEQADDPANDPDFSSDEPTGETVPVVVPVHDDPSWSDLEAPGPDPVDRVVDPDATVVLGSPVAAGTATVPVLDDPMSAAPPYEPPDAEAPEGRRRRRWPWVVLVLLLLVGAGGAVAALTYEPPAKEPVRVIDLPVPGLVGSQQEDAEQVLGAAGWEVEVKLARRNDTQVGEVLEVTPGAGSRLPKGRTVVLTVSEGQEILAIPQGLVGESLEDVEAAFTEAGFVVTVDGSAYDEKIAKGSLIQYVDGTPGEMERGSTIGLIVSDGPRPRTVPGGLAGRSEEEATSLISDEGLKVAVNRQYNDDVKEGTVVSQAPAGGTTVPRGDTVTIEVSQGPETVKVPSVASAKTPAEAAAILRSAGLKPNSSVSGSVDGKPTTKPAAGTEVKKGSTVDIVLK
ncbi:MAG: PASTA domain-containing protein [Aquihabitans sp.]